MKALLLFMFLSTSAYADQPSNLLVNGGFDQDAIGWSQVQGSVAFWDIPDASFNPFSGSAWVVDDFLDGTPNFRSALRQCIPLQHSGKYFISLKAISSITEPGATMTALYVYWENADCSGNFGDNKYVNMPNTGAWETFQFFTANLPATGSIRMELGTRRANNGTEFSGHFDDVLVSDDEMFIDGFE